jgi:histidinol-phosphate aminotransferase
MSMPSVCDLAPANIRAIAPYQPGKPISELERELGISDIVKLASNENPLGASPAVARAVNEAMAEVARYPDGNGFALKQALAQFHALPQEFVVLGNGSNDVLELVAKAFLAPHTSAVFSQYAFAVYPLATQAMAARAVVVPARNFGHDLRAMAASVAGDTRVVWIANPNNPTGTLAQPSEIEDFLVELPDRVIVVLDEAYGEYLEAAVRVDSLALLRRFPNLIITRTFSKAYGLAGLRVGYALAQPAVADLLNRVRQPFNVSSVAQVAAVAALGDQSFVARSADLNRAGMAQLCGGFAQLGLTYIPSAGNFVTVQVGAGERVFQSLLRRGVIVRPLVGYGMPEHLRVTVGSETENRRFLEALRPVLSGS